MTSPCFRILAPVAITLPVLTSPATAQSIDQRIRAVREAAAVASQLCTTAPLAQNSRTMTLNAGAQTRLSKLVSWLGRIGISGAAKYETGSSQGVLQRDLAQSIRDSNKCRQDILNTLTQRIIAQGNDVAPTRPTPPRARLPQPIRPSPVPASFDKPNGKFVKRGEVWIETPPYAPGQNFKFTELEHDKDYVYLVDRSRPAPGTTDDPMVVRLPIRGGWAQWTYQSPPEWKNFITVEPSRR